jgi:cytoskeletal protein CcmA (bactofilin family)
VIALEGGEATVVVSETALIRGDIRAPNVVISGRVEGNVRAAGRVELTARAHVIGNVHYRLMEMQLGAVVEGQLLHHEGAEDPGAADSGEPPDQAAQPALKTVSSSGHGASG